MAKKCLQGTAAHCSPGRLAGGKGSHTQAAVGAYRVPFGDGSPLQPGPTSLGYGESDLGGGFCLQSAFWKRQAPKARAHKEGGRGVLPRRWSRGLIPTGGHSCSSPYS